MYKSNSPSRVPYSPEAFYKSKLSANATKEKDVDRLKFSFETTPIVNSDKFYAASLLHESTEYKNISQQRRSSSSIIILSTIFGLILGIFFVLILNLIQQRK